MSSGGDTPGDGLSTLQNGSAAYSQSGWFPVAAPAVFVFLSVRLLR